MSETYSVVFTGKIAAGMAPEQVKANVGKLFKLSGEQLEKLFVGKPVAVRRGVDREQAEKLSAALTKAGVIVAVKSNRLQAAPKTAAAPAEKSTSPQSAAAQPKQVATNTPPNLDCPRCGHSQPFTTACGLCKMDLTLHIKRLQRREQARAMRRQASA